MGPVRERIRSTRGDRTLVIASSLVAVLFVLIPFSGLAEAATPKVKLGKFCVPNGTTAGQCKTARGVAANGTGAGGVPAGSVYVVDAGNKRIQQFSATGAFIRTFGKAVNETTGGDVCTAASGNTCKVGTSSTGPAGLSEPYGIAIDQSTGAVYVSDRTNRRINVFSAAGVFEGAFGWDVVNGGASGTGNINGTTTISSVGTTKKAFSIGQVITGEGIPANTTITAVGAGTITLSQATTETKTGDALTVAPGAGNVPGNEQQTVALGGSPTGGTFTLSFTTPNPSNTTATTPGIAFNATALEVQSALEGLSNIGVGNVAVTGAAGGPWTVEFTGTRFADTNVTQITGSATGLTPAGKTITIATAREGGAPEFCTSNCQVSTAGGVAGQFSNLEVSGVAVDPRNGNLYVADLGNLRLDEYTVATNGSGEVIGASFSRAIGWKVNLLTPAEELQQCTAITGCQKGSSGAGAGQFIKENPGPVAVDSSGNVYAVNVAYSGSCSATVPCGILKFNPDGTFKEAFGPSSGECQVNYTSGTASAEEVIDIAVDPVAADHDNHVFILKKVSSAEYRVYEFSESGTECTVSPPLNGSALVGNTSALNHGMAVGTGGRIYSNQAGANAGEVVILGEAPAPMAEMSGVTHVEATSATFVGKVTPPAELEGQTFPTTWRFEYSTDQSHWVKAPVPDKSNSSLPGVAEVVEESVAGLLPNTHYFVRLCATTGPTACSAAIEFTTNAIGPTVIPFSAEVTQTGATLGAEVNPNLLASAYHVEWATPAEWAQNPGTYGHRIPAQDRQIGSGAEPIVAAEQINGLAPATLYHFRVIATNSAGTTSSPDQRVETLNSCGMTDGRCFELVSRVDKGPLANPGKKLAGAVQPQFQAAPGGSALAYTVELGYPEATAGSEAVYLARRGSGGWGSEQVTPATLGPPTFNQASGLSGAVKVLSENLGCSIVASPAALTADAPASTAESGGANLFRRDNTTGAYRVITSLPPVDPPAPQESGPAQITSSSLYQVIGMSSDCQRVIFRTQYRYPGIPSVTSVGQLYEWDHGTIRNVAMIPGPGGTAEPVAVASLPGAMNRDAGEGESLIAGTAEPTNYWRAVSGDGSRAIFTAVSRFGGDSGKRAIFRSDGNDPAILAGATPATDISQSETGTANNGYSRYWTASVDGKRIFFTARYGLASNGSSTGGTGSCSDLPFTGSGEGCDLYEYNADAAAGHRLTDLSPDTTDAKGAGVVGVLAASVPDDGSYVYFAARGRLGGGGKTETENLQSGTYNVYLAHGGGFQFVRTLGQAEATGGNEESTALISTPQAREWNSRSTADGKSFILESSLGVPGGVRMVYLFSAVDGSVTCLSCRHDGRAPFSANKLTPLIDAKRANTEDRTTQPITITANGRIYFYSFDPLATGAIEGDRNLYEWEHGQVSLIATEPAGVPRGLGTPTQNFFGGASADGGDVYFATPLRLIGADQDERWDVYDARVGGGFPEPAPPPAPCSAAAEGSCNSGSTSAPSTLIPTTPSFNGPGNVQSQAKPKAHKKKNHHKNHHKKKGKTKKKSPGSRAGGNRGAKK